MTFVIPVETRLCLLLHWEHRNIIAMMMKATNTIPAITKPKILYQFQYEELQEIYH